jgi:RimJ/RimL family protein N-acetyltransferase
MRPVLPIFTHRLVLRPLAPADAPALLGYHGRSDVHRFLPTPVMNAEAARAKLSDGSWSRRAIENEGEGLFLGIELREGAELVGDLMLSWRSEQHQVAEIGWVIHADHSGKGYATEASCVVLAMAFTGLEAHRVVAYIDSRNQASVRLAERLGMQQDGLMRENKFTPEGRRSELVYSLLRYEWKTEPIDHP